MFNTFFHVIILTVHCLQEEVVLTYLSLVRPYLQSNASANKTGCWPSVPPTVQFVSWGQDHHTFFSDWDVGIDANVMYLSNIPFYWKH